MSRQEIIDKLIDLGWLPGRAKGKDVPDVAFEVAKAGYAQFHGVPVDKIDQHMQQPRCALPDVAPLRDSQCRWPDGNITVCVTHDLPPLTRQQFIAAVMEACGYWAAVAGLKFTHVNNQAQARIVITTGSIDQPGGTLAWSELPCPVRRLTQKYDTNERWVISANPQGNSIDVVRVVCHELGHALGMDHIQSGNLLAPIYSPTLRKPQAGDVREMQSRYGPPLTVPGPTPTPNPQPTPGGGSMGDIFSKIFGEIFKAVGPKLIELLGPLILKAIEEWLRGIGPKSLADELTKVRLTIEAQPGAIKAAP